MGHSARQSNREGTADAVFVVVDFDTPLVNIHYPLDKSKPESVPLAAVRVVRLIEFIEDMMLRVVVRFARP